MIGSFLKFRAFDWLAHFNIEILMASQALRGLESELRMEAATNPLTRFCRDLKNPGKHGYLFVCPISHGQSPI